jgi:benzodiazapine receptor
MDTFSLLALLGFMVACFVAALGGAVFRPGEWYEYLAKPSWRFRTDCSYRYGLSCIS